MLGNGTQLTLAYKAVVGFCGNYTSLLETQFLVAFVRGQRSLEVPSVGATIDCDRHSYLGWRPLTSYNVSRIEVH